MQCRSQTLRHRTLRQFSAVALILTFFTAGSHAEDAAPTSVAVLADDAGVLELAGPWRCWKDDHPDFAVPEFDDSLWLERGPYVEPGNLVGEGETVVWFRTRFHLDFALREQSLALYLPLRQERVSIYLNGRLLHETHPHLDLSLTNKFSRPALVPIPAQFLRSPGTNVLALQARTEDDTRFEGNLLIGNYRVLLADWVRRVLWLALLSSVQLFLGVFYALLYFQRRQERYYLFFAILVSALGLWLPGFLGYVLYVFDTRWTYILAVFLPALIAPFAFYRFFLEFFGFRLRLFYVPEIFYTFTLVAFLTEFFTTGDAEYFKAYFFVPYFATLPLLAAYTIGMNIYAVVKRLPFSREMLAGILVLTACTMQALLVIFDFIEVEPLANEGVFVMCLIFAFTIARRFSSTFQKLEVTEGELRALNETLERKVEERTQTIEKQKNEIEKKNRRLEDEIQLAAQIQNSLLPAKVPESPHFQLAYAYEPVLQVSGDFLDFYYDAERARLSLFICDVTGHGVAAAMMASMVKMSLGIWDNYVDQPAEMLTAVRESLAGKLEHRFVTAALCTVDLQSGEVTVANAGHPPTLHIQRDGPIRSVQAGRRAHQ